jgi:hypothetical protein
MLAVLITPKARTSSADCSALRFLTVPSDVERIVLTLNAGKIKPTAFELTDKRAKKPQIIINTELITSVADKYLSLF